MSQEKRDGSRVAMISRLEGEVMVFQPMVVREVSLRGALVETRFAMHLNSLHDLRGPRVLDRNRIRRTV